MSWPIRQDYFAAVQNPALAFRDAELKGGTPKTTPAGLPWGFSGAFASVYRMQCGPRHWAVKCFLQEYADQQQRYSAVSAHLSAARLPYTVGFDFQPRGIRIGQNWYPLLKMEWIQGERLESYIQANLRNPAVLADLAGKWLSMIATLQQHSIAHGDLQHGNVLVVNGELKLIDYDGMYVPTLAGRGSHEIGHPNYQHPKRKASDFGPYLDNFAAWVIYLSMVALRLDPGLWQRIPSAGDERILFCKEDFENPEFCEILRVLSRSRDPGVEACVEAFKNFTKVGDIRSVLMPAEFSVPEPGPPPSADWIKDHLKKPQPLPKEESKPKTVPDDGGWLETHLPPVPAVRISGKFGFERTSFGCLLAGFLLQLYLATSGLVEAAITAPAISALVAIGWGLLSFRFRRLPEVSVMRKLDHERERLEIELHNQKKLADETVQRKGVLESEESKAFEEMRGLHSKAVQSEREETTRLNGQLLVEQATIGKERRDLDVEESNSLSGIKARITECLNKQLKDIEANKRFLESGITKIEARRQASVQSENDEVANLLKQQQQDFLRNQLSHWVIDEGTVSGIGPVMKDRLWSEGICSAADFQDRWQLMKVSGIGHFKAQALVDWRSRIEAKIRLRMPTALPAAVEQPIRAKAKDFRRSLSTEEAQLRARCGQEEVAILESCKREKAALESSAQAVGPSYDAKRRVIVDHERTLRFEAQRKRDVLLAKWEKEKKDLEIKWKVLQADFSRKREKLEQESKPIVAKASEKNWALKKVNRDLGAYKGVNFGRFLQVVVFPWSR